MYMIKNGQRFVSSLTTTEDHIIVGPTSKLPLYKPTKNEKPDDHKIVGGVYERPTLRASYDSYIVNDILTQYKRYKNLKSQFVFQILGKRQSYVYLKKFALYQLYENLKKQFDTFFVMIQCKEASTNDKLSHNIFSWNWNDFLTRRMLKDYVWVNVLLRTEEYCLHIYKFQKDLEQLKFFVQKIFDGFFSNIGEESIDIYQHIEKPIDEAKKVLHTTDFVEDDLYINSKELKQLVHKEHFLTNAKRDSEEKFLKAHLENRIWNSHIWNPIEVRFHINWFKNILKQSQCHMDMYVEKYQNDTVHFRQMFELETFIDDNCMDYCYLSIEVYKNRINQIQSTLEKEFDLIENRLIYKRLQIDKLREQRKYLSEEIERFKEEEEAMRLRNEREQEEKHIQRISDAEDLPRKRKKGKKGKILVSK